jgi:hypothetical protein
MHDCISQPLPGSAGLHHPQGVRQQFGDQFCLGDKIIRASCHRRLSAGVAVQQWQSTASHRWNGYWSRKTRPCLYVKCDPPGYASLRSCCLPAEHIAHYGGEDGYGAILRDALAYGQYQNRGDDKDQKDPFTDHRNALAAKIAFVII